MNDLVKKKASEIHTGVSIVRLYVYFACINVVFGLHIPVTGYGGE